MLAQNQLQMVMGHSDSLDGNRKRSITTCTLLNVQRHSQIQGLPVAHPAAHGPELCSWCSLPFCRNRTEEPLDKPPPCFMVQILPLPMAAPHWALLAPREALSRGRQGSSHPESWSHKSQCSVPGSTNPPSPMAHMLDGTGSRDSLCCPESQHCTATAGAAPRPR